MAGLAISNSLQKLVFFSMLVKGFADIEAQMNSVDMIANQYTKGVPQEVEHKEQDPPSKWPEKVFPSSKTRFNFEQGRY